MNEKNESDFFASLLTTMNKNYSNIFSKTVKVMLENKEKEAEISPEKNPNERIAIRTYLKEHKILKQAKQEAESILAVTLQQSEKMYQEVQQDIELVKREVELKKRNTLEQCEKERIEAKEFIQQAEQEAEIVMSLASLKSKQVEEELSLKRVAYQQEVDSELEKLVKEKEQFGQYQQQVQESIERKEKDFFFENRKKAEQEQMEKERAQNKIDYLKALNTKRKISSYRIGLAIFGCTVVWSLLLVVFRQFTLVVSFISLCLLFIIACLAFALIYINLVGGKSEQKIKQVGFQNASLLDKNKELIETIENLEKDTKKLIEEKIEFERTERYSQDNIEFLKIIQADLKQSEMYRRVLESENTALRKYLISEETID
ncbi:hypothetical protein [Carnobacterium pleistocenium]|uniref:hypothetical protein n=1 Tax=Carnobacterium pleistocenium TaxID=181073 RepID=UPI000551FAA6|nr:hypothetical protein [Carnobacterium pleistocenium]